MWMPEIDLASKMSQQIYVELKHTITYHTYNEKYNIPDSMHRKSVIHQRKNVRGRQGSNDLNL